MGAYLAHNWYKGIELTFNNLYLKDMYADAVIAVLFDYRKPLFDKIRGYSIYYEFPIINILENSYPLSIVIKNGNLVISN